MTTTSTSTGSAFPPSVDELVPRVRELAMELGDLPSRNRVMRQFRVGADKARAVLAALDATEATPAGRKLHAVDTPADPPAESDNPVESDEPADRGGVTEPADLVTPVVDPGAEINPLPARDSMPNPVAAPTPTPAPVGSGVRRVGSGRLTLVLLALPAFVAIWSGWVGLGELTGFGPVRLLPGIADGFVINSAITLPIGVEAYAAFALRVWLSDGTGSVRARRFAKHSAIGALVLGAAGQVAYHLMSAAGVTTAPWPVITLVSCLPVVVLGCAAGLAHLIRDTASEGDHR